MRLPNWKQLIIFCVSLIICFFAETVYVLSCGAEPDPLDYYTTFFNPDLTANKGYEPFYYTALSPFYGVDESEEDANLREWNEFFTAKGAKASGKDIYDFIYTYSRPQMTALYTHIDKNSALQAADSVAKNGLSQYFIKSKDLETLGYLMFAKQCEVHAQAGPDSWTLPTRDSATMMRLSRNGIQLYNACKDKTIKERFAFQSTRLAHYSRTFKTALHYYDSLLTPIPSTSLIHYKSLALEAGALRCVGRATESAYFFSRVFDAAPSLRTMAYRNTIWTEASQRAVMDRCANDAERATVAALYAFRQTDSYATGLRETYKFDPKSPMLEVLLSREINKLEEGYLQNILSGGKENYWSSQHSSGEDAKQLQLLVDAFATEGKVKEPALWQITSAYLSFMQKDYAGANKKLAATKPQRTELKDQQEVVQLLISINEQQTIDKNYEAKLLHSLQWLDSRLPENRNVYDLYYNSPKDNKWITTTFYVRMYRNLLDQILMPRYQNDIVRRALVMNKRDAVEGHPPYYNGWGSIGGKDFVSDSMNSDQLIAMRDLMNNKKKTPYEKYLFSHLPYNENQLGECIALAYIRQHDFENAVTWFKRSNTEGAKSDLVLTEQLQDFGYEYPDSMNTTAINTLQYASKMVELEKIIKTKNDPKACYEYANGLFSISYYGHSYHIIADYRPSTWWYSPEMESSPFLREYFGCYRAEEYYRKAADATTDPEFKARALYMAARCAQKHLWDGSDNDNWWSLATYQNIYFPRMVKETRNTQFFKETSKECTYLKDYLVTNKM